MFSLRVAGLVGFGLRLDLGFGWIWGWSNTGSGGFWCVGVSFGLGLRSLGFLIAWV